MIIKIESQIIYLTVKRALFVIDMNLSCGAWNYNKNVWTSLVLYTTQLAGGVLLKFSDILMLCSIFYKLCAISP